MIIEHAIDCGAAYERERQRLLGLVRTLSDGGLATTVPATPAWDVRDVLAHLVGIAADLNALRFGDGNPDEWTAEQVRSRRGRTVDHLVTEWDSEAPLFEDGLRQLGYEIGSHFVGDLLQHSADVDEALGVPCDADDETLTAALDFYLDTFHCALTEADAGSVAIRVEHDRWIVGTGPQVCSLTTTRFQLLRCLGGRTSQRRTRELDWSGDVDRVIELVSAYPSPAG